MGMPEYEPLLERGNSGGDNMAGQKKDHSKSKLNAPDVQGQGTTMTETGAVMKDSSRMKQKQPRQ
jgi:hypothetical protein